MTLGNASAALTWLAPENAGGEAIDRYVIESSTDGASFGSAVTTTSLRGTLRGLTAGTEYWFRVRAHNASGYGPAAGVGPRKAIVVPGRVNVTGAAGDGQVALSIHPTTDGTAPIDFFRVDRHLTETEAWVEVDRPVVPSSTVTGLTNGQSQVFRVRAHNAAGYGPAAKTSSLRPTGAPTAPRNPVLDVAGINEAFWDPPASDGGHPVDLYRVEYWIEPFPSASLERHEVTTPQETVAVDGARKFRVQARNLNGWGDWSELALSPHYSG